MLNYNHLPAGANVQYFVGAAGAAVGSSTDYQLWTKPAGTSMVSILLVGKGGDGGAGAIGANSTAAGGGGGGSGAICHILIPAHYIPDVLFLLLAGVGTAAASCVATAPLSNSSNALAYAVGGTSGTAASGATAGNAGGGGAIPTAANMSAGWAFSTTVIAGASGGGGGTTGTASALAIPTTGVFVTGGTGGAGLGAAASTGGSGGNITGTGVFPTITAPTGPSVATTPPSNGPAGFRPVSNILFNYGGIGGCSTHGSATGAGLVQASGGDGAPGCGGGGSGGALTGSTAGVVGKGGPAFCIITSW